jgi:hypothetical protein
MAYSLAAATGLNKPWSCARLKPGNFAVLATRTANGTSSLPNYIESIPRCRDLDYHASVAALQRKCQYALPPPNWVYGSYGKSGGSAWRRQDQITIPPNSGGADSSIISAVSIAH